MSTTFLTHKFDNRVCLVAPYFLVLYFENLFSKTILKCFFTLKIYFTIVFSFFFFFDRIIQLFIVYLSSISFFFIIFLTNKKKKSQPLPLQNHHNKKHVHRIPHIYLTPQKPNLSWSKTQIHSKIDSSLSSQAQWWKLFWQLGLSIFT